jgi:hypothetical protein
MIVPKGSASAGYSKKENILMMDNEPVYPARISK